MSAIMILVYCGCRMVGVRKALVLGLLLIILAMLAAPVSASHPHPAPGSFNLTAVPAPAPAPSSTPYTLDASTRTILDAMAANDTSALAPPSTVFESVHPGESLQDAIDAAPAGSTLYLDPGTYYEHDLVINKELNIHANQTLGGTRANTIIDARSQGRIFSVEPSGSLFLDNLTLRNGFASGDGGTIHNSGIFLVLYSSAITNSSATGDGGAIWSHGMITGVLNTAISRCSVTSGDGGAIFADEGMIVAALYSTFTDCSAPNGWGGAIEADTVVWAWYSSFTRCSAFDGGALDFYENGAMIVESHFTDCTAENDGGAIWADGGDVQVLGSTFTRCTAGNIGGAIALGYEILLQSVSFTGCTAGTVGGAVATSGDIDATDTIFSGCSAGSDGGAVIVASSTTNFVNATFTGCTASRYGGAITAWVSDLSLISSSITGCRAVEGGAIYTFGGTPAIHFCRVYGNTASGTGAAINTTTPVDATHTWWGTNSDPGALMSGPVTYDPWLVLGITANPMELTLPQTSYIRTNLTFDSDGTDTSPGGIFVPDGIPNTYAVVSGPGIVAPASAGSSGGAAQGTYITTVASTPTIAGTVDGQTVYITLNVAQGTWTPAPTEVPNDDGWPKGSTAAQSGGGGGGGSGATGSSGLPLMTVTVNIGGDSKAHQAIVTGTNLRDLIVTGTVQHNGGSNCTPPAGVIFQYIGLGPARYGTITNAVINFTVPQSWLDANKIAPGGVVLYHMTPDCWQPLPTTFLSVKDGTAYFSGQSSGFSSFAVAGTPEASAPVATATQEIVSTPEQVQETIPPVTTKAPVVTQTTTPPAPAQAPAKSSPFPLVPVIAVVCCIGLIGGGWYARRWWIRRQNPALFEEC